MKRLAILLLALLALAGCGGSDEGDTAGETQSTAAAPPSPPAAGGEGGCEDVELPPTGPRSAAKPKEKLDLAKTYRLEFVTSCGSFTVTLDQRAAPKTSASLVSLARKNFYDKTVVHRIVPDFVIQGGDPTATGTGGPGYSTQDIPRATARYVKGVVAMAKTGTEPAGTSGSQFFVVTGADVGLPPEYAVVGKVTDGLAVVERIGLLGDVNQQPTRTILIEDVVVTVS